MSTIRLVNVNKTFAQPAADWRSQRHQRLAGEEGNHSRGPVKALDQVTLTIPDGQTLAVVGPSGCGKSTLLRVVAGLDSDYQGQIFYDNQEMTNAPPKDRYIGMVFQNYALYPHFEGHGNLSFFFRLRKISDTETTERIRITSEIMGLGFQQLLYRKPGTLSGGQQQRLAIARAIVRNPRLFLFDEPLSNLDAKLRNQTRVEIKRLLQRFQITAIYVTHDQIEAMALGDQVAVMRAGRVEQLGPFQQVLRQPATVFVASFLGSPPMNLFYGGRVVDDRVQLPSFAVPLPAHLQAHVQQGQALTVGVRPEAVRLVDAQTPSRAGVRLQGIAEVVEPDFGRQTQLVYTAQGALRFVALGALDIPVFAGHPVTAQLDTTQLHLFDATSEQRIG
ncbi:MAG: ABC transporter ATP-binding protein [Caldilineaceae bacterium]|nr:ABC transporter ATP-binding protein [Caldilineaceae bacterium]